MWHKLTDIISSRVAVAKRLAAHSSTSFSPGWGPTCAGVPLAGRGAAPKTPCGWQTSQYIPPPQTLLRRHRTTAPSQPRTLLPPGLALPWCGTPAAVDLAGYHNHMCILLEHFPKFGKWRVEFHDATFSVHESNLSLEKVKIS